MEYKAIIETDGSIITEVIDRGAQQCATIKQLTNALGREISDEKIGDECDRVEEINVGG
jgi:hypothetical protein